MNYRDKVLNRIEGSERSDTRKRLWEEICSAYERGGAEEVQAAITDKVDSLRSRFDAATEQLKRTL